MEERPISQIQKRWIRRLFRIILGSYLRLRYKVRIRQEHVVHATQGPCIVLGNHSANWDPFFVSVYIEKEINFITSDVHYRNPIVRWGLSLVNSIPKTKAVSDTRTIRHIVRVCRQKGVIGIFPEGQSCWDGRNDVPIYATSKLIKVLKIPVIYADIQGAFLSCGRWCRSHRKGAVFVTYHRFLSPEEIRSLDVETIHKRLTARMQQDQVAAQKELRIAYRGRRPAQYLERSLFICPSCYRIGSMRSGHSVFRCTRCGYALRFNQYGLFEALTQSKTFFETIGEWNEWQQRFLSVHLQREKSDALLFSDAPCVLVSVSPQRHRVLKKVGTLCMYKDSLQFHAEQQQFRFPVDEIVGANVQKNERMEFFCRQTLYSLHGRSPRSCLYKYLLSIRLLKEAQTAQTAPVA